MQAAAKLADRDPPPDSAKPTKHPSLSGGIGSASATAGAGFMAGPVAGAGLVAGAGRISGRLTSGDTGSAPGGVTIANVAARV
jgi:hypothetical protein